MQNSRWLGRGRGRPQSAIPAPPPSIHTPPGLTKRVQSQDDLIYQENLNFLQMQTTLPLNTSSSAAFQAQFFAAQPPPSKVSGPGLNFMPNQSGPQVFYIYYRVLGTIKNYFGVV